MTHALVIGSGVAGPVLAMALQRAGIDATVFERDPAGAEQRGAWLTFQANGMDALAAIYADAPVRRLGYPLETISFVNGKGKPLGRMPLAAPRDDGQLSLLVRRGEVYAALSEQARQRGARVQYGKEFVDAVPVPGGIQARFADGSTADGDLLIGCDGIHSRVRQIIDPQAAAPRYVPVLNVGGYIPDFPVDVPPHEFRMPHPVR